MKSGEREERSKAEREAEQTTAGRSRSEVLGGMPVVLVLVPVPDPGSLLEAGAESGDAVEEGREGNMRWRQGGQREQRCRLQRVVEEGGQRRGQGWS